MFATADRKRLLVGLLLLVIIMGAFLAFNRLPKIGIVGEDLDAVSSPGRQCFQGFCIDRDPGTGFFSRWIKFSVSYLRLVTVGMTFAFITAGLAEAFLFSKSVGRGLPTAGVFRRTVQGAAAGGMMNLCSACIVPVSSAFHKRASIEGAVAMVQGSTTLNIPALAMVFFVFSPVLGFSRLILAIVGALIIGPIVVLSVRRERARPVEIPDMSQDPADHFGWKQILLPAFRQWAKSSIGWAIRLSPIMILAGFASGLVIQWLSPEVVATYLGNDVRGVLIAATFGVLINVPLLFEIPLVALLLLLGMGTAPAATLLFAAAAGGPVTFWGLAKLMPRKAIATFATATWTVGAVGGLLVLLGGAFFWEEAGLRDRVAKASERRTVEELFLASADDPVDRADYPEVFDGTPARDEFAPFQNIAPQIGTDALIENRYPGVAIFDFDRDGDLDFYVTSAESNALFQITRGGPNKLFRNDGDGRFTEVAASAGVAAETHNSTAVAACDFDNDGYQDLYVGAQGRIGDNLDYRSAAQDPALAAVVQDRLFLNNGDGTFTDITATAFAEHANVRSAASIACGDVDNDGWTDIYIGNRADQDFVRFDTSRHHGHYNTFFRNNGLDENGNLTFSDLTLEAGLVSPPIRMRDPGGNPITFPRPGGEPIEGFDISVVDANGNVVGDPAGQTWATMFFDHDSDGDLDLWVADDGDRLKVYRNDSTANGISFTSIEEQLGIDQMGQWMGFALGDYDGDGDLDVFVTNMGFQPLARPWTGVPSADCVYYHPSESGTCFHALIENRVNEGADPNRRGAFEIVTGSTKVEASRVLPPISLTGDFEAADDSPISGLEAYEFGFGTVFFDMDNDADQDLYWLGSLAARGEGPNGDLAPGFGRMLQNTGDGAFRDVTVESRMVGSLAVDYSVLDPDDPDFSKKRQRLGIEYHENGKGVAVGDLNGDGSIDVIVTNSNGEAFDARGDPIVVGGPLFVWMNSANDNNWISFRLTGRMAIDGTGSNADAIGAKVIISHAGPDGGSSTQIKEVLASSSFLSMSSTDVHFGLGSANKVNVIIEWPSGITTNLTDQDTNQLHELIEPAN
ncbi:MAG: VCBS repeat-containing protein [Chloroflexi bacterium]|nr:VCBS repeat-containing protein [Chloroflexota bacterium]